MRDIADDFVWRLRVVPVGAGDGGIQSDGTVGEDFVAGVLGAHRVCVRTIVDFAEEEVRSWIGDSGVGGDFSGDAGVVGGADAVEE